MGTVWTACLAPWNKQDQKEAEVFTIQELPPLAMSLVMDYLTSAEVSHLTILDPRELGRCVTFHHVTQGHSADLTGRALEALLRSGHDFHPPSNQRILRIQAREEVPVLCDLCHRTKTTLFCWYWGLMKCEACIEYHEQHDEYEIERFTGPVHPWITDRSRKKGPRKYFVRWAGDTLPQFEPLLATHRIAAHGGMASGFHTKCVLAEPAFDPYTGEPCGPLVTHKHIDAMEGNYSPKSIENMLAYVDLAIDTDRVEQVKRISIEIRKEINKLRREHKIVEICVEDLYE